MPQTGGINNEAHHFQDKPFSEHQILCIVSDQGRSWEWYAVRVDIPEPDIADIEGRRIFVYPEHMPCGLEAANTKPFSNSQNTFWPIAYIKRSSRNQAYFNENGGILRMHFAPAAWKCSQVNSIPVLSPLARKPVTMGISWGPPFVLVKDALMLEKDCS